MNFLAHIFLSGNNDRIKIGNFMGDGIRGRDYQKFHTDIQIGVLLHREIDSFTDFHEVFRTSKHRLVPKFNHFSGIIVDMFYDYFLAKNWQLFSDIPLKEFSHNFYEILKKHENELNDKTRNMMPYMIKYDWLYNYQDIEELERILGQMDQRFGKNANMKAAVADLKKHHTLFEDEFFIFFNELRQFTKDKKQQIITDFSIEE